LSGRAFAVQLRDRSLPLATLVAYARGEVSRTSLRPGGAILGEFDTDRAREGVNTLTAI
jgi:hypothetical protein